MYRTTIWAWLTALSLLLLVACGTQTETEDNDAPAADATSFGEDDMVIATGIDGKWKYTQILRGDTPAADLPLGPADWIAFDMVEGSFAYSLSKAQQEGQGTFEVSQGVLAFRYADGKQRAFVVKELDTEHLLLHETSTNLRFLLIPFVNESNPEAEVQQH
jgi:hypothetical protein